MKIKFDNNNKGKYDLFTIDTNIWSGILTDIKDEKQAEILIKCFVTSVMLNKLNSKTFGYFLSVKKASDTTELRKCVPVLTFDIAKKYWGDFIKGHYKELKKQGWVEDE